jgi:hypothetical protein
MKREYCRNLSVYVAQVILNIMIFNAIALCISRATIADNPL